VPHSRSLAPATRLGPYEILAPVGAGGMGEVYRGRDTKLNRDVALKILPDAFATDPDRLARFTREAQTLAALNHPNIAHIHGLEEGGGIRALVMELVEGEDLAQRLVRGPIPSDRFRKQLPGWSAMARKLTWSPACKMLDRPRAVACLAGQFSVGCSA
jgi:serine/threonine protein kinase